ncbi:Transcription-repair-coupling factor [Candidatus Providencia siddallii]|uniref:Transcription-repair-coupling factor n=1 Tax=Candidatus Providencia siddallii TaxID=1715285 RepID=A0A0M6W6N3_9GAMM|nr:Transcription-repair-coupling factor [Candidatus Providencia siddallii]
MLSNFFYNIPISNNNVIYLGCLIGSAKAIECAEIIERHKGIVVIVTNDTQNALRLFYEIKQFTKHIIEIFSDWETLPYDNFSPNQEIVSHRLSILYRLPTIKKGCLIIPVNTLMQKVCPKDFLITNVLIITKGDKISIDKLRQKLNKIGYHEVVQVLVHGEYAVRSVLFDLFPMGSKLPFRIYFFNGKVDRLCTFDIDSQRSIKEAETISLLPAHEFPTDKVAIEQFRTQWRIRFGIHHESKCIYQQVSKNILPSGIEYWSPLFFSNPLCSLFDYFPTDSLFVLQDLNEPAENFQKEINRRYENYRFDLIRPLLPVSDLWLCTEELNEFIKKWPRIYFLSEKLVDKKNNINLDYLPLPDINIKTQGKQSLEKLSLFIKHFNGIIIFFVENEGRREFITDLLININIFPKVFTNYSTSINTRFVIIIGVIEKGFIKLSSNTAMICESDLLGERVIYQLNNYPTISSDLLIRSLEDLNIDQLVVHIDHGVGRYQGLITIETAGINTEYLIIMYADNTKLYVPVSSLHLISRYSNGVNKNIQLNKLGSDIWLKTRQKALEKIRDTAAELLDIYAYRVSKQGFSFKYEKESYLKFCQGFKFEITKDQETAINAVLNDMFNSLAMDRLVCGDVGFGKTEVAMRASFIAIINNKQVAVLVPTTLLAQQHYDNFKDRFANWPVKIEVLSRFKSTKEQKEIILKTSDGEIDILIGTHKLLQRNLRWKDLGLLIVDEEHRFGVRHKMRIKSIRSNVDILTLTATPIPRTLNMAMSEIRDLSIIATPPARRLAVKTFVCQYNDKIVREAILREVLRGGQVYYLYNDVDNIEKIKSRLEKLVPEANFLISHGQMRERDLERVMTDFYHHKFSVLICTTIVETGIDIPTANTIIIERADNFGLAQLHQLRGRVGRSYHQAYAYLLTPHRKNITKDALKRLDVISSLKGLSVGFILATHDLEIRGAGELLGEEQSGQITTIGYTLYIELLKNAIDSLKKGHEPSLEDLISNQVEIELHMPVILPNEYIQNINTRLSFYKRIASVKTKQEIDDLTSELIDRFGNLPDSSKNLLALAKLKLKAKSLGIKRVEAYKNGGFIEFTEKNIIDFKFLISLPQNQPKIYNLDGSSRLKFFYNLTDNNVRFNFVKQLINDFEKNQLI